MARTLSGTVISIKMQDTAVVEVTTRKPHPLYKKLLKKSKKYKVATNGKLLTVGDQVRIVETKPMSKDKYFAVVETMNEKEGKKK